MTTEMIFDEINKIWLGFNEDGDFEARPLDTICEHFGVTEEWFKGQLYKRLDL